MIERWEVQGFKSIQSAAIDIRPINVVLGPNSLGKSSLLQSILFMAQAADEQLLKVGSGMVDHLSVSGFAIDLDSAKAVVNDTLPGKPVSLSCTFTYSAAISSMPLNETFVLAESKKYPSDFDIKSRTTTAHLKDNAWILREQTSDSTVQLSVGVGNQSFGVIAESTDEMDYYRREMGLSEWFAIFLEVCAKHARQTSRGNSSAKANLSVKDFVQAEFPLSKYLKMLVTAEKSKKEYAGFDLEDFKTRHTREPAETLRDNKRPPVNTDKITSEELNAFLKVVRNAFGTQFGSRSFMTSRDFAVHAPKGWEFARTMLEILHLGPIRVVQPLDQKNHSSPSKVSPLGPSGEYVARYLLQNGSKKANYPLPPRGDERELSLSDACSKWLEYFQIDGSIRAERADGLVSRVTVGGRMLNQLGAGISQVLPVILLSLVATTKRNGSLVLLEQPELHLHPGLQRKLADFLVAVSSSTSVKFLIETHSEYLLTRLRLLAAEKKVSGKDLSVIFVETRSKRDKRPIFKQVQVDEIGRLSDWPRDFFGETLSDRFRLSAIHLDAEDTE